MRRTLPFLAALLAMLPGAALAQAAPQGEPETVTSDAQRLKDEQLSRRFVQSLLRPSTSLEGQFAKWKGPVCPQVHGVNPASALVIERRIREIATRAGAPVDRDDPCIANVSIIFTDQPQARLDALAALRPFLLQGNDQKLTVRYPVQVWYAALKEDYAGNKQLDIPWQIAEPWRDCIPGVVCDLPQSRSNDSKLHSGQTTEIATVTVLVDNAAVTGLTLGEMGDYLALMTLSQTPATGRCQPAPSIANLFLKDCSADFHTTSLSEVDLAMLTALYQTPDQPEKLQAMRIVGAMQRNLEGESRK
jgi:hypothetical protein